MGKMEGNGRSGEREPTAEEVALGAWRRAIGYQRRLLEFSQYPGVEVRASHVAQVEDEVAEARAAYQELTGHDVPMEQQASQQMAVDAEAGEVA